MISLNTFTWHLINGRNTINCKKFKGHLRKTVMGSVTHDQYRKLIFITRIQRAFMSSIPLITQATLAQRSIFQEDVHETVAH